MTDILTRASALKELVGSPELGPDRQRVAEAVLSCCNEFLNAGEAKEAIDLLNASVHLVGSMGSGWAFRFDSTRARSLYALGLYEDSLSLTRSLLERGTSSAGRDSD